MLYILAVRKIKLSHKLCYNICESIRFTIAAERCLSGGLVKKMRRFLFVRKNFVLRA